MIDRFGARPAGEFTSDDRADHSSGTIIGLLPDSALMAEPSRNSGAAEDAFAHIDTMTAKESDVFRSLLKPDDSYDEKGTYWADMSIRKRIAFVGTVDGQETKRELAAIGRMVKNDPLSPIGWYFRNMVIPGAGLGLERGLTRDIGNYGTDRVLRPIGKERKHKCASHLFACLSLRR